VYDSCVVFVPSFFRPILSGLFILMGVIDDFFVCVFMVNSFHFMLCLMRFLLMVKVMNICI